MNLRPERRAHAFDRRSRTGGQSAKECAQCRELAVGVVTLVYTFRACPRCDDIVVTFAPVRHLRVSGCLVGEAVGRNTRCWR